MKQKLGQHILQIRGISYKPEDVISEHFDGYVPIIKSNNITEEGFISEGLIYIKSRNIRPEQFIRTGDIVLTASSGSKKTIGKNIQFDSDYNGSFGAFCKLIRPKSTINPKYLYHFFKTRFFRESIEKAVQGANISNLKNEYIDDLKIPLPSLDDQIRIATVLTRAEKLIAKRKESIKALDKLLKSTFLEMFGDPVRNEKGWEKKRIDEIAEVRIGPFGSLLHAEDYVENGIPLINPSHIIDGEIVPDHTLTITPEKYKELETYQLKINDVVVARRGEIGRCAMVRTEKPLFCGTGSMYIRIYSDYYPLLLQYQIYNTSLKYYLESKAKGVTMKNLNSTTLGDLQILYPPIPIQKQFAAIVEKVESLKSRYTQSLTELENLYGSLSQRAFKGELDLSKVPVILEGEIKPVESKMTGSVNVELKTKSKFTDKDFEEFLKKHSRKIISFDEIWNDIKTLTDKEIPSRNDLQKKIIELLESNTASFEQVFDILTSQKDNKYAEKQIAFGVNYEN